MSYLGFFYRFTVSYIIVMALIGTVVGLLEFEMAGSLNTAVLAGIYYLWFYNYSNKNSRIVRGSEKWTLILLSLIGDIITNLILVTPAIILESVPIKFIVYGELIIIPLHTLLFFAMASVVKRQMLKQRPELSKIY